MSLVFLTIIISRHDPSFVSCLKAKGPWITNGRCILLLLVFLKCGRSATKIRESGAVVLGKMLHFLFWYNSHLFINMLRILKFGWMPFEARIFSAWSEWWENSAFYDCFGFRPLIYIDPLKLLNSISRVEGKSTAQLPIGYLWLKLHPARLNLLNLTFASVDDYTHSCSFG